MMLHVPSADFFSHGILLLPSVARFAVVFEIFPPCSRQDDKSVVYVMLEHSEASFYLNYRV